jgi:hypothetical protein
MLTASSLWLHGYMYHFIALTHQATVIMTLFYLPFGKLFPRGPTSGVDWCRTLSRART